MTEEIKNQSVHGIIIRIAVFLTLGVLFSLIIWIWKSESLSSINIYDGFLLLAAITVTGILAMLYFRYWKTGGQHYLFYSVPFLLGIWLFLILPVGSLAYLATSPGYYDYSISTEGLDHYSGGLTTDIIVPLPEKNGESIIPEDHLQYRRFGNWTSLLVMTPQGKMLAFQTAETNLTDINAHFLVPLESPVIFPGISKDLLHPVIKQTAGTYTQWENDTFSVPAYTTQVYVDKEIEPVRPGNNSIRFDLNMISRGGMFFGRYCESYQVLVSEDIPEGIAGMIPVNVQIAKNPALPALDGYHNEGIAFNGTGYS